MVIYNKKKRLQYTPVLSSNVLLNSTPSASVYFLLLTVLEEANLYSVIFPSEVSAVMLLWLYYTRK